MSFSSLSPTLQDEYAALDLAEEDLAREIERKEYFQTIGLRDYVREFWKVREVVPFQDNWVIGAICEHLTACYDRQIRRLIINIYFRSGKSNTTSCFFPSWVWTKNAGERFLFLSYAQSLAIRDAEHTRDLIKHPLYQKYYGDKFKITKDTASYFENNKSGSRISIGSESQQTGFGANIKVFDDPNDTNKVESQVDRDSMNNRFDNLSTRSDNFADDVWILIQQRTHPKDVTGHIDELGGMNFEKLVIPLEYDGKKYVTSLGVADPRTKIGEVADPVRFPEQAVVDLKMSLNYRYAGQAQQLPRSPEGNVIKRAWFPDQYELPVQIEDGKFICLPEVEKIRGFVDLGASDSAEADRTAMNVKMKLRDGRIIKLWQYAGRWNPEPRNMEIRNFYLLWKNIFPQIEVQIEATFGLAIKEAAEIRNIMLNVGLNVKLDPARKSKVERFSGGTGSYLSAAQAGRIEFYQGDLFREKIPLQYGTVQSWKQEFFDESSLLEYRETPSGMEFAGGHDDLLDDDVGCYNILTVKKSGGRMWGLNVPEEPKPISETSFSPMRQI